MPLLSNQVSKGRPSIAHAMTAPSRQLTMPFLFSRHSVGVDHFNFNGESGGAHHCLVAYMCMICHGYVVKATQTPNPGAEEAYQKQQLQGVIPENGLVLSSQV